jgi:hypothetical protein
MKTYLLLRNNKQLGPHTLDELLNMGLKPHDLIWVEGKSGAWRYPSELDEFKSQIPVPADLSAELPFTQVQNDVLLYMTTAQAEDPEEQADELHEFPTLALFMKDMAEPKIEAQPRLEAGDPTGMEALSEPVQQKESKQELPEAPKEEPIPSKIMVTLPAARTESKLVLIHRPEETVQAATSLPAAPDANNSLPAEPVETISQPEDAVEGNNVFAEHAPDITAQLEPETTLLSSAIALGSIPSHSDAVQPLENSIEEDAFLPPAPALPRQPAIEPSNWLARMAVAAAVTSLLAVASLVAYSIFGPDPYQLSRPIEVKTEVTPRRLETATAKPATDSFDISSSSTGISLPAEPVGQKPKPAGQKTSLNTKTNSTPSGLSMVSENKTEQTESTSPIEVALTTKDPVPDVKSETRKNISKLVSFRLGYYKVSLLGGVSAFEVVLINGTAYPLDKVDMELEYILSNGKTYKTEKISFQEIAPGGSQTIGIPKSSRGVKVLPAIRYIESRALDLSYRQ